ncbi:MAG: Ig-like domain-containing protein [Vicinamibacterales bacterium]
MLKRAGLLLVVIATVASAQPATRRATNIAALLAYPGFYHLRQVIVVGTVGLQNDHLRVSADAGSVHLVTEGNAPDGVDEVRGEFWDLGRMRPDDPQLAGRDLRAAFGIDRDGPWPRPGEATAIVAAAVAPVTPPSAPSIRAIVLHPERYRDQQVTLTGQFSGRNLLGELPDAPGRSRYDFVLRSADAALWISGIQPKVKDNGRDFELGLDARIDTNRWVRVSGKVQQRRGLIWIEGEAGTLALDRPPTAAPAEDPVPVAPPPPPEVVFSAPTEDESDVSLAASVRIQFSRDVDQTTFKDRVRVSYLETQSVERGEPATPTAEFATQYDAARRVLILRFTRPLERFRTLKVELQEGILATDKQPLKPWTLTFATGGS